MHTLHGDSQVVGDVRGRQVEELRRKIIFGWYMSAATDELRRS